MNSNRTTRYKQRKHTRQLYTQTVLDLKCCRQCQALSNSPGHPAHKHMATSSLEEPKAGPRLVAMAVTVAANTAMESYSAVPVMRQRSETEWEHTETLGGRLTLFLC